MPPGQPFGVPLPGESSSGGDGLSRLSPETCGCGTPRMPGPEGRQAVSIGPVEYVILGFPGNKFTGQIVPELAKLIDSGLIRIIDLTFISEDAAGEVEVVRVQHGRGAGRVRRPRRRGRRDSHRRRRRPRCSESRAELLSSAARLGGHLGGPVRSSGARGQRSHPRRRTNPARVHRTGHGRLGRRPRLRSASPHHPRRTAPAGGARQQEAIGMPLRRRRPIARVATTAVVAGTAASHGS